jgi:hypothetical protein
VCCSIFSDVGSSELCRTFAARVLKLKVVAKFIAALCFAPNFEISALTQQNPTLASTLGRFLINALPCFDLSCLSIS